MPILNIINTISFFNQRFYLIYSLILTYTRRSYKNDVLVREKLYASIPDITIKFYRTSNGGYGCPNKVLPWYFRMIGIIQKRIYPTLAKLSSHIDKSPLGFIIIVLLEKEI